MPMTTMTQTRVRLTITLLLVVYILNFLDRQIVAILAQPIAKDLGLNDTQIGLMTGLAFALFYTGLGIPIARLADRPTTNRIWVISGCLAVWSAMTALCGAAANFVQIFLARIGVGIGEAGGTPPAHSLIAEIVPPHKRASALSLYQLGPPIGGLIGMVLGGILADSIGWRMAFVVVGLPGILLALVVLALLRDPRTSAAVTAVKPPPPVSFGESFSHILASRANRRVLAACAFSATAAFGMLIWGPIYLQRSFGLSASQTGIWFGLVNGIGSALGVWLGGQFGDRLMSRGKQHLLTVPAVSIAVASPLLVLGLLASQWQWAMVLFFPALLCLWLHVGPCYSAVQGLVPSTSRATASASILLMQNLFGLGIGSPLLGWLSDHYKPEYGADSVRYVLVVVVGTVTLAAGALLWSARKYLPEELDRDVTSATGQLA
jgi:MFS transporter, Spinster family, sphingosine-1-phosphate transporter